jgi:YfiH family protein
MEPDLVEVDVWKGVTGLRHGFSGRHGGISQVYGADELNLGYTAEDERSAVAANRATLLERVGGRELVSLRQVHSAEVLRVYGGDGGMDGDGLVTDTPGLLLGVLAADCVPVLMTDERLRAAGAFHAGWRGTAAGIVGVGVERMREEFGTRPEDLRVAIGPAIGPCCYAVGGDLLERFDGGLLQRRGAEVFLDLWEANRRQALAAGVPEARISVVQECTACARTGTGEKRYFSHRADRGRTGRAMGVVGWA